MKWFWKNNTKASPELDAIQQLTEQNNQLQEQCAQLTEQVTKLSRVQYKAGKDIQGKIEELYEVVINKEETGCIETQAKLEEIIHFLIQRLDELDLIYAQSVATGQHAWLEMVKQWTQQILQQLERLDVVELQVLGTSFDSKIAESIGTISRQEAQVKYQNVKVQVDIPYQVIEVLKRGFVLGNDKLLRKAQVITIEGERFNVE